MFEIVEERAEQKAVAELLAALPEWFGIPESTAEYVASADRLAALVARDGSSVVGVLLHQRHFKQTGEIHLLAVDPRYHRHGIGRALVSAVEELLAADGATLLSVKTLGESRPDRFYDTTRKFYLACGFIPVEEFLDLWPENPCLFLVKPLRRRFP